jgi:adenylate cyclase
VLTRKLYAAFEALPGKVTLVNPQISPDLSEPNLTFIHVPPGRAVPVGICITARRIWNRSSAISRWNITVILISWWPGPGLTAC